MFFNIIIKVPLPIPTEIKLFSINVHFFSIQIRLPKMWNNSSLLTLGWIFFPHLNSRKKFQNFSYLKCWNEKTKWQNFVKKMPEW
jgi:hypothetical protein